MDQNLRKGKKRTEKERFQVGLRDPKITETKRILGIKRA
jgi:hypothetical protein